MDFLGINQQQIFRQPNKFSSEHQVNSNDHITNVPNDWLNELARILQQQCSDSSINWPNQLNRHTHNKPETVDYLKMIYARLTGQLDEQFGPITTQEKQSCTYLLEQDVQACSDGFLERTQMYISMLQKPLQLDELLCTFRTSIMDSVARDVAKNSAPGMQIHDYAFVLLRAKQLFGIHTSYNKVNYSHLSAEQIDSHLEQVLVNNYQMHNLVDGIIQAIENNILRINPNLNYDDGDFSDTSDNNIHDDSPYPVYNLAIHGLYSEYLTTIIEDQQGEYDVLAYEVNENDEPKISYDNNYFVKGINWTDIRQRLWELLQQKQYIVHPEPDYEMLADNDVLQQNKAAYYFLALAKNDPAQLPQYCSKLSSRQCLEKVIDQALKHLINEDTAYLALVVNNIKLTADNTPHDSLAFGQLQQLIQRTLNQDNVFSKINSADIPHLLKGYHDFLGADGLKYWLNIDQCKNAKQLLVINADKTHQFLAQYLDPQTQAALLIALQDRTTNSHINTHQSIWHIAAQYYDAATIKALWDQNAHNSLSTIKLNDHGETALTIAIQYHNKEAAYQLLELPPYNQYDWPIQYSLPNPLRTAVKYGYLDIVNKLLTHYHPSIVTHNIGHQETVLETAISHNQPDIAFMLINHSSYSNNDVIAVLRNNGDHCYKLLRWAVERGKTQLFTIILDEYEASSNKDNTAINTIHWGYRWEYRDKERPNYGKYLGIPDVAILATHDHALTVIQLLDNIIQKKYNKDILDYPHGSPTPEPERSKELLCFAIANKSEHGLPIFNYLLQYAHNNAANLDNNFYDTLLVDAAMYGNIGVLKQLLPQRFDSASTSHQQDPSWHDLKLKLLSKAALHGQSAFLETLLQDEDQLQIPHQSFSQLIRHYSSPILSAILHGSIPLVQTFIDYGADINSRSSYPDLANFHNFTPLLKAIDVKNEAIAQLLLNQPNIDINKELLLPRYRLGLRQLKEEEYGDSPLLLALKKRLPALARSLIEKGAAISTSIFTVTDMLNLAIELDEPDITITMIHRLNFNDYKTLLKQDDRNTHQLLRWAIQYDESDLFSHIAQDHSVINAITWTRQQDASGQTLAHEAVKSSKPYAHIIIMHLDTISKQRRFSSLSWSIYKYKNKLGQLPFHMLADNKDEERSIAILHAFTQGQIAQTAFDIMQRDHEHRSLLDYFIIHANQRLVDDLLIKKSNQINSDHNKTILQALLLAVRKGQNDIVDKLIVEYEDNLHSADSTYLDMALYNAVKTNQTDIVRKLINDYQVNLNTICNKSNKTNLYIAVDNNNPHMVKMLLGNGADPGNIQFATHNALHKAIENNNIAIVAQLLEYNADPNTQDLSGDTPLSKAIRLSHLPIAKRLLQDSRINLQLTNHKNQLPLHVAINNDHTQLAIQLINTAGLNLNHPDDDNHTPLYCACTRENTQVVSQLLQSQNIEPNITFLPSGFTPFLQALEQGTKPIVDLFLKYAPDTINHRRPIGLTPLHLCCFKHSTPSIHYTPNEIIRFKQAIIDKLINEYQFDINTPDAKGNTPLMVAIFDGNSSMAQYLIQYHNPNIEHKNNNDDNPLTLALKHHYQTNKQTIIPELIGRGVKTKAINEIERQVTGGNRLQFLIREGYDLNQTNLDDPEDEEFNHEPPFYLEASQIKIVRSPIIEAINYNHTQAFKYLLNNNVSLKSFDINIFHVIAHYKGYDQSELLDYALNHINDQQKNLLNHRQLGNSWTVIGLITRNPSNIVSNYIKILCDHQATGYIKDWKEALQKNNNALTKSLLNTLFEATDNAHNIIHHIIQTIPTGSATQLLLDRAPTENNYLETSYVNDLHVELIDALPDEVLDKIYKQADFNVLHRLTQSSSANAPVTISKIINKINNKTYTNQLSFMKLNEKKQSSMHIAAANNEQGSAILEHLVRHYPNEINRKDSGGNTPLHTACFYNHENAALVLLQHGANPNLVNKDNRRPQLPPNLTYTSTQHQATGITTNNTYQQQGLFGGSAESSANNLPVSAENRP